MRYYIVINAENDIIDVDSSFAAIEHLLDEDVSATLHDEIRDEFLERAIEFVIDAIHRASSKHASDADRCLLQEHFATLEALESQHRINVANNINIE